MPDQQDRLARRIREIKHMHRQVLTKVRARYLDEHHQQSRFDHMRDAEDLERATDWAIMRALEQWDYRRGSERGFQFGTYLEWQVRKHVHRGSGIQNCLLEEADGRRLTYHQARKQEASRTPRQSGVSAGSARTPGRRIIPRTVSMNAHTDDEWPSQHE